MARREWNTPVRDPWNLQQAEALRCYVRSLKDWIRQQEAH